VTSVKPTVWETVAFGLGRGRSSCCARVVDTNTSAARAAIRQDSDFLMVASLAPPMLRPSRISVKPSLRKHVGGAPRQAAGTRNGMCRGAVEEFQVPGSLFSGARGSFMCRVPGRRDGGRAEQRRFGGVLGYQPWSFDYQAGA